MKKYAIPENAKVSTPSNPDVGFTKMYTKDDNKLYILDSNGNESRVGQPLVLNTSSSLDDSYIIESYTELTDNLLIPFIPSVSNVGAGAIKYGDEDSMPLVKFSGLPLEDDDVIENTLTFVKYDSDNSRFILVTPAGGAAADPIIIVPNDVTYNINNGFTDRGYDANVTSINELMDILDTLVNDCETTNLFGTGVCTSTVQTWTVSNVIASGDRTLDANATSLDELGDFIGTLIADLTNANLFNGGTLQRSNQEYTVTNLTTDRTADCNLTTLNELADLVCTIVTDLKLTNIID